MANISGTTIILDSWAFIEEFFDGPHRPELDRRRRSAGKLVTVREAVIESYAYILRRCRPAVAREWWRAIIDSGVTIHEPSLAELDGLLARIPLGLGLSVTDVAVAWAAGREKTTLIATGDRAFRDIGLEPIFAGAA